jgi:hypothetical protein
MCIMSYQISNPWESDMGEVSQKRCTCQWMSWRASCGVQTCGRRSVTNTFVIITPGPRTVTGSEGLRQTLCVYDDTQHSVLCICTPTLRKGAGVTPSDMWRCESVADILVKPDASILSLKVKMEADSLVQHEYYSAKIRRDGQNRQCMTTGGYSWEWAASTTGFISKRYTLRSVVLKKTVHISLHLNYRDQSVNS